MSNKSPQELETFKNSPAVKVLESLGKLLSLAEPYMKNGVHEDWQEFIATLQQIPAEFDRRVDEKVHSHMQAGFEYALGQKPKWNNQMNHEETLELTGQEHLWDEQSERAAEWLLGSKENGPTV